MVAWKVEQWAGLTVAAMANSKAEQTVGMTGRYWGRMMGCMLVAESETATDSEWGKLGGGMVVLWDSRLGLVMDWWWVMA